MLSRLIQQQKFIPLTAFLCSMFLLSACQGQSMRYPFANTSEHKSSDALCYKAYSHTSKEEAGAIHTELKRRKVNCETLLSNDPLFTNAR